MNKLTAKIACFLLRGFNLFPDPGWRLCAAAQGNSAMLPRLPSVLPAPLQTFNFPSVARQWSS